MRRLVFILAAIASAVLIAVLIADRRNPETRSLDANARRAAGGAFVQLGDGITHYEVAGPDTGTRVVLVHGFSVPYYIWDSTFVALTNAGFRVARYDTYGRGWSDRPDTRYDFGLFDRQLTQLLDSLQWNDAVHLVGLSYGGPVIGTFAASHPARVRSLVFVDPASGTPNTFPWYLANDAIGPWLFQVLAVPTMADGQSSDFVEPARWPGWADQYRVQQQFRGFGNALRRTVLDNAGTSYDSLYAAAGRTRKPAMLIWGMQDQTVPIANAAQLQRGLPQIEFHAIENAGHLPQMERTDIVNPLLVTWLRAH